MKNNIAKGYTLWQDYYRALITFCLIIIPEIVFLSTTCQYFSPIIFAISLFLSLISVFFLAFVSISNPGYIFRQEFPFAAGPQGSPLIYTALVNEPTKPAAIENSYFEYPFNSNRIKLKYCRTCWILRPPRSSHCHDCDLCVENFDHHCPWLGICIGKNNYLRFISFIFSTFTLGIFNLACCLVNIALVAQNSLGNNSNILESIGPSIFLGFFILLFMIFVGGLSAFHTYLISNGFTTNEVMKKSYKKSKMHPKLRKNCFLNVLYVVSNSKTKKLNLNCDVVLGPKNKCNITHSELALQKASIPTELDGNIHSKYDLKENISETPSIIHENMGSI